MQSRNISRPAFRWTDTWNSLGRTTTSALTTHFSESFTVWQDVTTGNHHTPNPNYWQKARYLQMSGQQGTVSQQSGTVNTGPSPYPPQSTLTCDFGTAAYNQALERMFGHLRGDLDVTVSMAEAGQVAGMLRSAGRLADYVRSIRRFEWAHRWLEYQYGWRPLVQDLYGLAKKVQEAAPAAMVIRARGSDRQSKHSDVASPTGIGRRVRDEVLSQRAEFVVYFQIKPTVLTQMAGYGSLNPVSIAWELLPYSFVADWVIDIGGYLRLLETSMLYASMFKSGYQTLGARLDCVDRIHGSVTNPDGSTSFNELNGYASQRQKRRYVLSSMPLPRPPRFRANLGSERLVSLGALLHTHFRGR